MLSDGRIRRRFTTIIIIIENSICIVVEVVEHSFLDTVTVIDKRLLCGGKSQILMFSIMTSNSLINEIE